MPPNHYILVGFNSPTLGAAGEARPIGMEILKAFPVRWGLVRFNLGQKSWSNSPQAWLKMCWVAVLGAPDGQRFVSHIPGHSPGMFELEWKWVEEREVKDDDAESWQKWEPTLEKGICRIIILIYFSGPSTPVWTPISGDLQPSFYEYY